MSMLEVCVDTGGLCNAASGVKFSLTFGLRKFTMWSDEPKTLLRCIHDDRDDGRGFSYRTRGASRDFFVEGMGSSCDEPLGV